MKIPDYIPVSEVKKVCKELGIRDWTALKKPEVKVEEARIVLAALEVKNPEFGVEDFRQGLEVELEHGVAFNDCNVTNNHPLLTGKIVLAHFKESLDYYKRLEVAEIEGDMLKAAAAGDAAKLQQKYQKLVKAKLALIQDETTRLG
ncbi:MAG: hypothetical protein PHV74_13085 [Dehalococcoidia bacterium]|nr:hypothetical protein [Dehalococcoidia bacterium]